MLQDGRRKRRVTRKVGILLAAALAGVGIRALDELGLGVVNLPPVERLGWLITVVSLSVATAAVFALAVGSKRAFLIVLPLLAITVLAGSGSPPGSANSASLSVSSPECALVGLPERESGPSLLPGSCSLWPAPMRSLLSQPKVPGSATCGLLSGRQSCSG